VPLLWRVLSITALQCIQSTEECCAEARWLLRHHPDVMLLAVGGFANPELMGWLRNSQWHYAIRLPVDVLLHGSGIPDSWLAVSAAQGRRSLPNLISRFVGRWVHRCNLDELATVKAQRNRGVMITDEMPSLQTLWHNTFYEEFRVEEFGYGNQTFRLKIRLRSSQTQADCIWLLLCAALCHHSGAWQYR